MRANYSTTANIEARQSLLSYVTAVEGEHAHQLFAEVAEGSRILDVGCGNGIWLPTAAERGPALGLDLAWPMLQGARSRTRAPLVCGDARRLPFRDDSVDVVVMFWMLYHLPEKATALGEVCRVLRPDGVVLAATNQAAESGAHADIIQRSLSDALGRPIERWLEPLDFNADNGTEILTEHFSHVDRYEWRTDFELPSAEPLVAYLASGRDPIEAELGGDLPWDDILARTHALAENHIATQGALRFQRTGATFIAWNHPPSPEHRGMSLR